MNRLRRYTVTPYYDPFTPFLHHLTFIIWYPFNVCIIIAHEYLHIVFCLFYTITRVVHQRVTISISYQLTNNSCDRQDVQLLCISYNSVSLSIIDAIFELYRMEGASVMHHIISKSGICTVDTTMITGTRLVSYLI